MPVKTKKRKRMTKKQSEIAGKNFLLAKHIAIRMGEHQMPMEDQIQEASVGMCKGMPGYKPERGIKLSTYVGQCAKNEILTARRDYGLIRIPGYLQEKKRAECRFQKYAKQAGKQISIDGISEDSEFHPASPDDDETEFGWKAMRAVRWAVQKLPPIERDVIRGLMFRGENAAQLGRKHGIHPTAVRNHKRSAMAKLRTSLAKHV